MDDVLPLGSGRAAASERRPRARTTEARRFPPPSGPGDKDEATEPRSPADYVGLTKGSRSVDLLPDRRLPDRDEDPVERRVQPDRAPQ